MAVSLLTNQAAAATLASLNRVPRGIPVGGGLGAAPGQPSNWPKIWSQEDDFELQQRLSQLPFYAPVAGFGQATATVPAVPASTSVSLYTPWLMGAATVLALGLGFGLGRLSKRCKASR